MECIKSIEKVCIFCLNNEDTFQLHGVCECRPYVHNTCVKLWFENKKDTCPICIKSYVEEVHLTIGDDEELMLFYRNLLKCARWCLAFSLIVLVISLILFLFYVVQV